MSWLEGFFNKIKISIPLGDLGDLGDLAEVGASTPSAPRPVTQGPCRATEWSLHWRPICTPSLRNSEFSTPQPKNQKEPEKTKKNSALLISWCFFWLRCFSDVFKSFNHFLNMFFLKCVSFWLGRPLAVGLAPAIRKSPTSATPRAVVAPVATQ
jgi:hypothetical protein